MDAPFIVKYQPKKLSDFHTFEQVHTFIKACITANDLNLMLIGDPGTGKTSLLNIIISHYFGEYANDVAKYNSHVLFINSLKEQGIAYYRNEVKTFCQTQSIIPGKKKFVILDDIDFINEQSQQVFRSCMDKYSENVNFLISCINTQKVIESLQSRTTLIRLSLLSNDQLKLIGRNIVTLENIEISDEAFDYLLKISNFSVRLLINYLEKIKLLNKRITIDIMYDVCSNINHKYLAHFFKKCEESNTN